VELRKLLKTDDRTRFSCGDPSLDDFFRSRAGQSQFRDRAAVSYVLVDAGDIAGFVTVLPGAIRREDLGPAHRRLPRSALPVLVLARMGVHKDHQRAGLGSRMLAKVLELAIELSREVGCVGVIVDAKTGARSFYERYGFVWVPMQIANDLTRGFLPVQTIEDAIAPEQDRNGS
jgi:GNAT superfamily N-acetyltransferase